jgi:hypothetical protein
LQLILCLFHGERCLPKYLVLAYPLAKYLICHRCIFLHFIMQGIVTSLSR